MFRVAQAYTFPNCWSWVNWIALTFLRLIRNVNGEICVPYQEMGFKQVVIVYIIP